MRIGSNCAGKAAGFKTRILALLGAMLLGFALGGCYAPGLGLTPRETGTLAGGALGAGGGALVGSTMGAPGTGAVIGGLGGALGGYLIGNQIQNQYYRPYYPYPYY
jgi:hypothetical protein